ncbi:MAG: 3'-5' exonuclease [Bacilli bacterium]|nr:3'-5' exonuclease [Bacilli bacterium]
MEYVVFDIETTGLNTSEDRIIEIGAIKVRDGIIVDEFNRLINPGFLITDEITNINGITNEMLEHENYPGVVLAEFNRFIGEATFLIGHNAIRFDYPFVQSEFKRNYIKHTPVHCRDTVWIARQKIKGLRSYSLKNLTEYFGIVNETAHRALSDVYATYQLLLKLDEM